MTDEEFINAIAAADASTANGFMILLGRLKRKGVIDNDDIKNIQEAMYKPLHLAANAGNTAVQKQQQMLDDLFGVIVNEIK